jgi:hypothetical protein
MDRIEVLLLLLEVLDSLRGLPVPVKKTGPGLLVCCMASALALGLLLRLLPVKLLRDDTDDEENTELALTDKRLTTARFLTILSGVIQSAQRLLVTTSNVHAIMHSSNGWES